MGARDMTPRKTIHLGASFSLVDLIAALIARPQDRLRSWRAPRTHGLLVRLRLAQRGRPPPSNPGAVSWIRRNIITAVAGALAEAHSADHRPPSVHIYDALRHAPVRLDDDARIGQHWARNAGRSSTLLVFF
jgi:hypothetical protein